jgi:hypothetical protein
LSLFSAAIVVCLSFSTTAADNFCRNFSASCSASIFVPIKPGPYDVGAHKTLLRLIVSLLFQWIHQSEWRCFFRCGWQRVPPDTPAYSVSGKRSFETACVVAVDTAAGGLLPKPRNRHRVISSSIDCSGGTKNRLRRCRNWSALLQATAYRRASAKHAIQNWRFNALRTEAGFRNGLRCLPRSPG